MQHVGERSRTKVKTQVSSQLMISFRETIQFSRIKARTIVPARGTSKKNLCVHAHPGEKGGDKTADDGE